MNANGMQSSGRNISRRRLLHACTLGLPSLSVLHAMLSAAPPVTGRTIMTAPLNVPADFVGMHFHRWPQGDPVSPAPAYGYGTVRSHDYGIAWNNIHMAPGRYLWNKMDSWVRTHSGNHKTLIYTLYGTPTWASSKPAVKDAYGNNGAGAPPKSLEALREFITALVGRYNTRSHRAIQYMEVWNEPHFLQNDNGFWWGSTEELVEVCRVVAVAAKATDRGVRILSPGFDGLKAGTLTNNVDRFSSSLWQFLQARDSTGRSSGYLLDGIAIHLYNSYLKGPNVGIEGILSKVEKTLELAGVSLPVYTTECGYLKDALFTNESLDMKATLLRRIAAVQAALGVRWVCFYAHDDEYCWNPSKNAVIAAAINDIHTKLAGHRLKQVTFQNSGKVDVQTTTELLSW